MKIRADRGRLRSPRCASTSRRTTPAPTSATCGPPSGQQLGEVSSRTRRPRAGRRQELPAPVADRADTTYVVSYHSSPGRFAFSPGAFVQRASTVRRCTPRPTSRRGGNGVYRYGRERLPGRDLRTPRTTGSTRRSSARGRPTRGRRGSLELSPGRRRQAASPPSRQGQGHLRRADGPRAPSTRLDPARGRHGRGRRRPRSPTTTPTRTATLTPPAAAGASARPTRRRSRAAPPASPTSPATASRPTRPGRFTTPGAVPVHGLRAHRRARRRAAVARPAARGRREVPLERGRLHHRRCASTSSRTTPARTSGHLWSATGAAAGGGDVHERDRLGLADRRPAEPGRRSSRTRPTSPPTTRAAATSPFDQGYFAQRVDNAAADGARQRRRRRQRRLPLRRQRLPDTTFNATNYWVDATFERTVPPDTRGPDGHRDHAGRRRQRRRPRDVNVTRDLRRAARRRHPSPARPSRCATPAAPRVPADGHLRRPDAHGEARPDGAAGLRDAPTRRRSRAAPGGVTDAAGNPLAADKTWSFTSRASRPRRARAARSCSSPTRATRSAPTTRRSCAARA